jgi:hypothetical protein
MAKKTFSNGFAKEKLSLFIFFQMGKGSYMKKKIQKKK